jgi:chromosome partitioning protein
MPPNQQPPYIRCPAVRSKFALDHLLGPSVNASSYLLKKITGKEKGGGVRNLYTPADIRHAKLALYGIDQTKRAKLRRPPIIHIRMAKGGTGKSVIAGNVAAALPMLGYKVLAIDGDPQASLTNMLGVDSSLDDIVHIGHLMLVAEDARKKPDIDAAIKHIYPDGMLDLIPADITLTQTDAWLMGRLGRDSVLDRLIEENVETFSRYDAVVIDSAPGTTLLSYNFMAACKTILAVVWLDRESLKAINLLVGNVSEINRAYPEKKLDIEIIANGYHPSYSHCKEALAILAEKYKSFLNENVIPHYSGFARQQSLLIEQSQGPLVEQEPNSIGAKAMFDLAKSLLGRYGITLCGFDENITPLTRKAVSGDER